MHILIGFFVAAVLLYWWARGSVIVAILGTLFFVAMIAVSDNPFPLPAFLTVLGIAASWAPYAYKWRKRRVTFLAPAATVATQFRR